MTDVTPEDFEKSGLQYMVGRAPILFGFLTSLPGLEFKDCWESRMVDETEEYPLNYLSKEALIEAKTRAGRPQDLADLDEIRRGGEKA